MGRFREPERPLKIGTGAFGDVFECLDTETGRMIAVKKVVISDENGLFSASGVEKLLQEISLMKRLAHPNIVQYRR